MGKRVRRQGKCLKEEGRRSEDMEGLLEKCCGVGVWPKYEAGIY